MEIKKKYTVLYMYQADRSFYLIDYDSGTIEWSSDNKNCLIFPNEPEALKAINEFPWFVQRELCIVQEID